MIGTDNKSVYQGQPVLGVGNYLFPSRETKDIGSLKAQHLYVTSVETPKDGDWCVDTHYNTIIRFGIDNKGLSCEKIIATTDKSLRLPLIFILFIKQFIEEYNKGNIITKVMVEYEKKYEDCLEGSVFVLRLVGNYLKINSDNTINIRTIKNSWNRDEINEEKSEFIHLFFSTHYTELSNIGFTSEKIRKWVKENL